ncbi:unnamed protein product, partial [Pylaiella littoralis]
CGVCHELWPTTDSAPPDGQDFQCGRSVMEWDDPDAPMVAKFGSENGMIPGEVPQCLKDLTMVEAQMVARAHPVVKTYRKRGGQRHYEGHVISLSQDITELAMTLPWRPCTAEIPIVVVQPPDGGSWEGRQFTVSVSRVEAALAWLVAHNPAYAEVRVDIERIRDLGDGEVDVMDRFDTIPEDEEEEEEEEEGEQGEDGGRGPAEGERERDYQGEDSVRRALELLTRRGGDNSSSITYPRSEGPLREDTTPLLATMCFPTLFPDGHGDPFSGVRLRKVSVIDTLTHLMRFADMPAEGSGEAPRYRFASHRTFAYWCLNIRMRAQAKEQTRVFLSRNSEHVELPLGQVGAREIQQLVGSATRWTANVSGTDGYWLVRGGELEDAVDQLDCPSVFFTNSAADHHWRDMHRLFPQAGEEPAPGDPAAVRPLSERHRALIDNPHIADWWVWERMKIFNDVFLGADACDATWRWMRAEWQNRASLHVHGCWCAGVEPAPGLAALSRTYLRGFIERRSREAEGEGSRHADGELGVSDEEYEQAPQDIFGILGDMGFTATNPAASAENVPADEGARQRGRDELARDLRDFDWTDEQATRARYENLLNASMRHTNCGSYCLKDGRCRFGFPKERNEGFKIHAQPLVHPPTNRPEDWQVIVTPPNVSEAGVSDGYVNRHFVWQLLAWGGNVDASPIVDHGMAYMYMVKYATKGESRCREAQRLLTRLVRESGELEEGDENRLSLRQILRRVMQTCTTRRDMGAQEMMHLLMQTPSVNHDLEFVTASATAATSEVVATEAGGLRRVSDLIDGYAKRCDPATWARARDAPSGLDSMPYSEFASRYRLQRGGKIVALTSRNRVVSFRPFVSSSPRGPRYYEYCRNSLVKFRAWSGELWNGWGGEDGELATTDDPDARQRMIDTWQRAGGEQNDGDEDDGEEEDESFSEEDESFSDDGEEDNLDGIHGDGGPLREDEGFRRVWADGRDGAVVDWSNGQWAANAGKQQLAVDLVCERARVEIAFREAVARAPQGGPPPEDTRGEPLRLVMSGTAGTGKTVAIREMLRRVGQSRFLVLAPTGNAACALPGGQTIHSGLRIPVGPRRAAGADPSELSSRSLAALQSRLRLIDFILVDEFSMIGQALLGLMSVRGKQAARGRPGALCTLEGLVGGLNLILVGDPSQLPPVGEAPIWNPQPTSQGHTLEGYRVWLGLNAAVELTEVRRQEGEAQAGFRRVLSNVAEGCVTQADWEVLQPRMRGRVTAAAAATFQDAVHLYPTNDKADRRNWERLNSLQSPIARINAEHTIRGFTAASADRFRGLQPQLFLAVGARVFVNNNIWTSAGLANGAAGVVVHMHWAEGRAPPSVPDAVFVRMDNYSGPQYVDPPSVTMDGREVDLTNVVPIAPYEVVDDHPPPARRGDGQGSREPGQGPARCVRTQLPLAVAFAITIHKSQGQSLLRAVVDIGSSEKTDGQTFTALSRLRSVQGLLLEDADLDRFLRIGLTNSFEMRLRAIDRI